jgi:hypothetical protein
MSEKQEPQTVNLKELTETINSTNKMVKDFISKSTPAEKPVALTESLAPTNSDYKANLVKMLKSTSPKDDFRWEANSFAKDDIAKEDKNFFETIGAAAIGSATPTIWSTELQILQAYPASAFLKNPAITWHEDISGKAGDNINVITVLQPIAGTAGCAEPNGTAPTVSALNIGLTEWQCSYSICRTNLEDMIPETVDAMNEGLTRCLDAGIDNYIASVISPVCGGTVNTGTFPMTPAQIANTVGSVRAGTEEPVGGIMHPVVEAQLMRDSQFVNAATFGARDVITGGHITNYLGIPFVVVPCGSLAVGGGTAYETYILAKGAVHAAMKRPPVVESQYLVQTQKKYVYASVRFGASMVNKPGAWKIRSGITYA